jgi:hypothetical protein
MNGYASATKGNEWRVVYSAPVDFSLLSMRWNSREVSEPKERVAFSFEAAASFGEAPEY